MEKGYRTIRLDSFSLSWLGKNPAATRSAGIMSITYNQPLDNDLMKQTIIDLLVEYPFFCGNLALIGEDYYLRVPKQVDTETIKGRISISENSQEETFNVLSKHEFDLFNDELYQIHLLDHDTHFDIIIYGAHLLGDGLTSATALSILTYNYYLRRNNRDGDQIYPPVEYKQLLQYAYKMRHTRTGILWVPRWLRFIPGYLYYRRKSKLDVPDQVLDDPVPIDEELIREKVNLGSSFIKLLDIVKEQFGVNSNHLISSLLSYAHLDLHGYDRSICTYPINIRNNYGFEAGNLLSVNRVEVEYKDEFIDFLLHMKDILEEEKNSSGPYYVLSLGKFVKNDYDAVQERLSKVVKASNLRFSNIGRLPVPNLNMIDTDTYDKIPLSNYYANALPLGNIGAHFFISSIRNEVVNDYYLTILYSNQTYNEIMKMINYIKTKIVEQLNIFSN